MLAMRSALHTKLSLFGGDFALVGLGDRGQQKKTENWVAPGLRDTASHGERETDCDKKV